MHTRVFLTEDSLEDDARSYDRQKLKAPVFLNSIPKGGTHLIRNIFRMFAPMEQQWTKDFIQLYNLRDNLAAFDSNSPYLSWGHLFHDDIALAATSGVKQIILARDPYEWVLSRARFFLSDQTQNPLDHLRRGSVSIEAILNIMILGVLNKTPSLASIYEANIIAWLGGDAFLVRYEDIVRHLRDIDSEASQNFFLDLLKAGGIDPIPDDWKERVVKGSDKKHSSTARENLTGKIGEVPASLPEAQRQILDYHAPGLRKFLGYEPSS